MVNDGQTRPKHVCEHQEACFLCSKQEPLDLTYVGELTDGIDRGILAVQKEVHVQVQYCFLPHAILFHLPSAKAYTQQHDDAVDTYIKQRTRRFHDPKGSNIPCMK